MLTFLKYSTNNMFQNIIEHINKHKRGYLNLMVILGVTILATSSLFAQTSIPSLSINVGETDDPSSFVPALKILALLTVLAVAPAILLMTTSFTRILIVLSFTRQALGTQTMPPNQVVVGLALFLTFFTMSPVFSKINKEALTPYLDKKITQEQALDNVIGPMKTFMLSQTRESDLGVFAKISNIDKPQSADDVPLSVVLPSFMVSELKTAFQIGFLIYIPFLIIDMVISSTLMAMGMLMLPPTIISLPFKLILFILVDGWSLIVEQVVKSFNI